jgi:hypothetical protein
MSPLHSLQAALQRHILMEEEADDIITQLINPAKGVLDDRLAVYSDAYQWRLIEALKKRYPLLHEHLGEDVFEELAEVYIDEYPSRSYSIHEFTNQLPDFLLVYRSEQAYLGELAALIRALSFSFESADAGRLDRRALTEVPMENWPVLCFKYHPSVQCLTFQWNTFALWKALIQKTVLPSMSNAVSYCMVWRKELQPYANHLTRLELEVFQAFQAGRCFADVCEMVYASGVSNEEAAAAWLAHYLTRGLQDDLFSEVYIP